MIEAANTQWNEALMTEFANGQSASDKNWKPSLPTFQSTHLGVLRAIAAIKVVLAHVLFDGLGAGQGVLVGDAKHQVVPLPLIIDADLAHQVLNYVTVPTCVGEWG